jgi:hypothetical protein
VGRTAGRTCHLRARPENHPFRSPKLVQRVRLIRKLAPVLNGIDLSKVQVSDVIYVPEAVAAMLIREGWAELVIGDKVVDT